MSVERFLLDKLHHHPALTVSLTALYSAVREVAPRLSLTQFIPLLKRAGYRLARDGRETTVIGLGFDVRVSNDKIWLSTL